MSNENTGAASSSSQQQNARIRYGVHSRIGDNVGKSIKQLREEFGRQWSLPADAQAYNGTDKVGDDYIVKAGDSLEFHRRQGEKG